LQLPPGHWATVLDALCDRFPAIDRSTWLDRFSRGRVLGPDGLPMDATAAYRVGMEVRYFREVEVEPRVPYEEGLVHVDDDLVVADKPHFLPVTPAGGFVQETLLARLVRRLGNPDLVPLHRIDRATAGLVLLSANPATRACYQSLFRERRIRKRYEALALPLSHMEFPHVHHSRLARGEPFFRMREVEGNANSETRVEVLERGSRAWHYALEPVTGRKHQLRVHMAALGAPILGDPFYPALREQGPDDPECPLQLLARGLSFEDPVHGGSRRFESRLSLRLPWMRLEPGLDGFTP